MTVAELIELVNNDPDLENMEIVISYNTDSTLIAKEASIHRTIPNPPYLVIESEEPYEYFEIKAGAANE